MKKLLLCAVMMCMASNSAFLLVYEKIKKLFLFILSLTYASAYAQDILITQNGDVMNVYDVEISPNTVFYKNYNTPDAPTLRINKNNVFMIKRKDGTRFELGNGVDGNEQTAVSYGANYTNGHVVMSSAIISEASQRRNEEIIIQANTFNPEYVGKDTNKACARVMCIMGLNENSQLVNDEIEITPILGIICCRGAIKKNVNAEGKVAEGSKAKFQDNTFVDPIFRHVYSNPAFQIKVKNKTSKTLYIDLGNTFFLRNDVATAYYVPSSTSSSNSSTSGASVNLGAVAGALGIGGALGTLANGIGVGNGATSGTVNTTYSQRIIAVPPKSVKNLDAQLLFPNDNSEIYSGLKVVTYENNTIPVFSFSTKEDGNYMSGETHDFSQPTSPINFRFYVTYADNETCQNERNMSFGFHLRRLVGFGVKKGMSNSTDYKYTANKLPEVMHGFGKCTYFIGFVGKASDNGFPRGNK